MDEKHCGDCKFFGCRVNNEFHLCHNDKSIFKVCLPKATACDKYEKETERRINNDTLFYFRNYIRSDCYKYNMEHCYQQNVHKIL